jgi:hypothetical protein
MDSIPPFANGHEANAVIPLLQDRVINGLCGVALVLTSARKLSREPAVAARLDAAISETDSLIRELQKLVEGPPSAKAGAQHDGPKTTELINLLRRQS